MLHKIQFQFVDKADLQRVEIFGGDIELNAVAAIVDFKNAFMIAVPNDFISVNKIIFKFGGHCIQLLFCKFDGFCLRFRLFCELRQRQFRESGTNGSDGSGSIR